MTEEGREKALETTLANIKKRYGEGAIMKLGQATHLNVEVIPTGSLALDIALGVGGIPRGRVSEIFGPESSGKTTLCQHIIAEAQRMGDVAAFIDVEHALDPAYAARCGVDAGIGSPPCATFCISHSTVELCLLWVTTELEHRYARLWEPLPVSPGSVLAGRLMPPQACLVSFCGLASGHSKCASPHILADRGAMGLPRTTVVLALSAHTTSVSGQYCW